MEISICSKFEYTFKNINTGCGSDNIEHPLDHCTCTLTHHTLIIYM